MRYKYKQDPLLGGSDLTPILSVRLGRGGYLSDPFEALVDSGASICIFHSDMAEAIGIKNFRSGEIYRTMGVSGVIDIYAHRVRLHVEKDSFEITAYFSDQLSLYPLLGRNGFFDKYIVIFDHTGSIPEFELRKIRRK